MRNPKKTNSSKKRNSRPFNVLLVFFVLLFLISGTLLFRDLTQSVFKSRYYSELSETAAGLRGEHMDESGSSGGTSLARQYLDHFFAYFTAGSGHRINQYEQGKPLDPAVLYGTMKAINKDYCGWLLLPGTGIDYPVVRRDSQPDHYLSHDFNDSKSKYGTPFIDSGCDTSPEAGLLIYGHNMKDGSMFAGLSRFETKDYMKEHPLIYFYTETGLKTYRIFSCARIDATREEQPWLHMLFADDPAYSSGTAFVKSQTRCGTGRYPKDGAQVMVLMTCEYTQLNGRLAVFATLEEE